MAKRRIGRNKIKCANYRARRGLPNGPGAPGSKKGKRHTVVDVKNRDILLSARNIKV